MIIPLAHTKGLKWNFSPEWKRDNRKEKKKTREGSVSGILKWNSLESPLLQLMCYCPLHQSTYRTHVQCNTHHRYKNKLNPHMASISKTFFTCAYITSSRNICKVASSPTNFKLNYNFDSVNPMEDKKRSYQQSYYSKSDRILQCNIWGYQKKRTKGIHTS